MHRCVYLHECRLQELNLPCTKPTRLLGGVQVAERYPNHAHAAARGLVEVKRFYFVEVKRFGQLHASKTGDKAAAAYCEDT